MEELLKIKTKIKDERIANNVQLMKTNLDISTSQEPGPSDEYPGISDQNSSSCAEGKNMPHSDMDKPSKLCVIENGNIRIPEDNLENHLADNVKECTLNNDATVLGPENPLGTKLKNCLNEQIAENSKIIPTENLKTLNPNFNVTCEDISEESSIFEQTDENPNPEESPPTTKPVNIEVVNKLLDYYRKFNERQMGITVDDDVPYYKTIEEPPVGIVCDNDIMKEAVLRVHQKQEAGEVMKEPTIIEMSFEEEAAHKVGWKAVELESKLEQHVKIKVETDDEEDEEEQHTEILHPSNDKENNDDDDCVVRTNLIEKTLQKRIDQRNPNAKKWNRKDIVKLVGILSEKRARKHGKVSNDYWSTGQEVDPNRDDLVYKLEKIETYYNDFKGESLFAKLKRGESDYDDASDMKQMIMENSIKLKTEIVSKRKKEFHGGEELSVVYDYIKNIFNLHWVWVIYEIILGKFLKKFQRESLNYGRNSESKWFKWRTNLSQMKWLTEWLPHSWRVGVTGKPIYKQVSYQDTDITDWKTKIRGDMDHKNVLKNRRRRTRNYTDEHSFPKVNEEILEEERTNNLEESVIINVEENEETITDDEEYLEDSDNKVYEDYESEEEDVIGNFRKMRSLCSDDHPLPGRLYIEQPDGKIVFNMHNVH